MKFEKTQVFNIDGAMRGMRNPMNSHHKADTINGIIGENDLDLANRLIAAGTEHRKFLRQIMICVDITAPLFWWSEYDTYKLGTTANSTSTMHKIMSKPFTFDLFECKGMRGYKKIIEQVPNEINEDLEMWKEYPFDSKYLVSNQGRVKHISYLTTSNRTMRERILSGSLHSDGYIFISLCLGNSKYKQISKHRVVAETWIENNDSSKNIVNHKDGNKMNNSMDNLEWVTQSENIKHSYEHNLQPKSITTYKGKLSKEQRDEIIFKYSTQDISRRELAKEYDVSHTTISSLLNNKYNYGEGYENEFTTFLTTLDELNELRDEYLLTKDKEVWKTLIEKLPRNWLQTRTCTLNYENVLSMYNQRKNHKLSEWSVDFCTWAESLPYFQTFSKSF